MQKLCHFQWIHIQRRSHKFVSSWSKHRSMYLNLSFSVCVYVTAFFFLGNNAINSISVILFILLLFYFLWWINAPKASFFYYNWRHIYHLRDQVYSVWLNQTILIIFNLMYKTNNFEDRNLVATFQHVTSSIPLRNMISISCTDFFARFGHCLVNCRNLKMGRLEAHSKTVILTNLSISLIHKLLVVVKTWLPNTLVICTYEIADKISGKKEKLLRCVLFSFFSVHICECKGSCNE